MILAQGAWGGARFLNPDDGKAAAKTLRRMATAYIDRYLAERTLSPESIAAALRLSRSTLYRLFEPDGGVASYVIARRLDRCFDAIAQGRGAHVGAIAFAHGFASEAHFSRAFRARFGISPREVRVLAERHPIPSLKTEGIDALAIMPQWVRGLGSTASAER